MLDNGIRHKSERLSQFPPGSGGAVMFTSHARSPPNGLPTIYHITWRKDGTCFTPLPIPFAARMFVIMNKNVKEKRYDTTKPRKLDAGHTDTQITLINKGDSSVKAPRVRGAPEKGIKTQPRKAENFRSKLKGIESS